MAGQISFEQVGRDLTDLVFLHTATDDKWPAEVFLLELLFSGFCLTCGFFAVRQSSMTAKQQAWILSALNAIALSSLSLFSIKKVHDSNWDMGKVIYKDTRMARFTITWFMAFLILDLIIGCKYYRSQIHPLSGWFHHIFYLFTCAWSLQAHFATGLSCFMVEELPTFVLALGSIYPECKTNVGFGASFFITRLAFHALLSQLIIEIKEPQVTLWPLVSFTMALHCYWFYGWVVYFRKELSKQRAAAVDKDN